MIIEYAGRNFEVDDAIRSETEERLGKLLKILQEPIEVHLALEAQKHRHSAELHVTHRHGSLQSREESDHQMVDAVQLAIDKAERQARKAKSRQRDRRRRVAARRGSENGSHWPVEVVERASLRPGGQRRVIKSSLLQIKPMSIEEAALQLDGSKNDFVVFRDSETDRVSVLYKRKDENYGLIAPEL